MQQQRISKVQYKSPHQNYDPLMHPRDGKGDDVFKTTSPLGSPGIAGYN